MTISVCHRRNIESIDLNTYGMKLCVDEPMHPMIAAYVVTITYYWVSVQSMDAENCSLGRHCVVIHVQRDDHLWAILRQMSQLMESSVVAVQAQSDAPCSMELLDVGGTVYYQSITVSIHPRKSLLLRSTDVQSKTVLFRNKCSLQWNWFWNEPSSSVTLRPKHH